MSNIDFNLQVPIGPDWRNVELLRSAILNCLAAIFQNHDFCETVGMVTSELLENAIKYGSWETSDRSRFELKVFGAHDGVHVEVTNPVKAGSGDAELLEETLAAMGQYETAQEAYFARLREVAAEEAGKETSRLGLARIAYEGNCLLEVARGTDNIITVKAVARP